MSSSFNKFNQFSQDLIKGVHNFSSHTFKIMLTNSAPVATSSIKSDLTDISAGNGYTAGGTATTVSVSFLSAGVAMASGTSVVFTASGGPIPPSSTFRYAVLYNDTQSSPVKPLVGWWDYNAAITLQDGETLTVTFDAVNGIFTLS